MDDTVVRQPRRTQEERKAHSRRKIIRAAIELFARQGYMRTTLNEVGDAAGYTGGLVSHRFGSKQGLLHAVVESIGSRFFQDQLQPFIEDVSAEVSIKRYIEIYLREILERESRIRALYVIMGEALGSVPEIAHEIAALNDKHRNRIADIVRRGVRSGEFRRLKNAETTAIIVLAELRGITMQALADPGAVDVLSMISPVQRNVLRDLKKNLPLETDNNRLPKEARTAPRHRTSGVPLSV